MGGSKGRTCKDAETPAGERQILFHTHLSPLCPIPPFLLRSSFVLLEQPPLPLLSVIPYPVPPPCSLLRAAEEDHFLLRRQMRGDGLLSWRRLTYLPEKLLLSGTC